jgi:acyl-CoA synthetase (AMP-forming)/AMP-acid ligase II
MRHRLLVDQWPYHCASILDILWRRSEEIPHTIPFYYIDYATAENTTKSIDYKTLLKRATQIATLLQIRAKEGERVLLIYPAGLEYLCAFFGCLLAKMIAVPVYPPLNARLQTRLSKITEDSDAQLALTNGAILATLSANVLAENVTLLNTDDDLNGLEHAFRPPIVTADTIAFLQYTSGSTGTPKGVIINHRNLIHNFQAIASQFQYGPDDHLFSWLPAYHDMGLIGSLLSTFAAGIPVTFMSPAAFLRRPARWLQEITQRQCTISGAPNFAYDLCTTKISDSEFATLDLSGWKLAFSGSEPVRPATVERFLNRFCAAGFEHSAFYPCYGMAETTLLVSGNQRGTVPKSLYLNNGITLSDAIGSGETESIISCGHIAVGFEVKIIDPATEKVLYNDGSVGEIAIAGNSVSPGYWRQEMRNKASYIRLDGDNGTPYFKTGDLGAIIAGELYVCGRHKDLIIIRGQNYFPHDIEETVNQCHSEIRKNNGIAFGITYHDQEHLVFVQEINPSLITDHQALVNAIYDAICQQHALQPLVIILIKNGTIPKTTSGKLARQPCKDLYLKQQLNVIYEWRNNSL